jgi:hypothetical protein
MNGIGHIQRIVGPAGCVLLLFAQCILVRTTFAQSKTGTTIGQFTLIEPSARTAAMGGAGGSLADEAFAGYYNPGAFGALLQSDVQFSHNSWFAGISLNYAAGVFRLGEIGTAAVTFTSLSSGDIPVTTVEQPLGTGEHFTVDDLLLGVGYGFRITDRFTCGLQVSYIHERIWHSSTSTFGFNVGTLYQLSPDGLRIGASLMNFGFKSNFDGTDLRVRYDLDAKRYGDNSSLPAAILTDDFSLPFVFRVSLGYPIQIDGSNTVTVAVDALHPSDNSECINVGAEWGFAKVVYLRAGYNGLFQTDNQYGLTAGAGVAWDGLGYLLHVDYGWAKHAYLGSIQRLALGVGF